jgi:hypothetical protein
MGFDILLERDITANVLLSCDQQAMRNLQSFGEGDPAVLDNFLAVPGSEIYQNMLNGRSAYQVFRMQKAR